MATISGTYACGLWRAFCNTISCYICLHAAIYRPARTALLLPFPTYHLVQPPFTCVFPQICALTCFLCLLGEGGVVGVAFVGTLHFSPSPILVTHGLYWHLAVSHTLLNIKRALWPCRPTPLPVFYVPTMTSYHLLFPYTYCWEFHCWGGSVALLMAFVSSV